MKDSDMRGMIMGGGAALAMFIGLMLVNRMLGRTMD